MKEQITILSAGSPTTPTLLISGEFNFSVRGNWTGTVTLSRSFDNGTSWGTVTTYTANKEDTGTEPEGALYRASFTTATSGTPWVRFGQ